jgi:hypothetical protein
VEVGSESESGSGQGAKQVARGGNLNQLDNQTAVHERESYMLYRKTRNKTMKRGTTERRMRDGVHVQR